MMELTKDHVLLYVLPGFLIILAILAVFGLALGDDSEIYISSVDLLSAAILTVFPLLRIKHIFVFPYWFIGIVSACIFLFGTSLFFGFYKYIWWWDEFSHWFSSIIVAMIVFFSLCLMQHNVKRLEMSSTMIVIMTFYLGFAFGGIWEIYEGAVDWIADADYMSYSLFDTLADIHMDFLGSLSMAAIAAYVLRNKSADELTAEIDERKIIEGFISRHRKSS